MNIEHLRFNIKHKTLKQVQYKLLHFLTKIEDEFSCKVDYFHSTNDGETSEKPHGASYSWQHVHKFCCSVLGDSVKCWGVKEDPHIS